MAPRTWRCRANEASGYAYASIRFEVRPYRVPEDDPHVAALSAAANPDPWTVADIEEWRRTFPDGGVEHDVVGVDEAGEVVGHAQAYRYPWAPPGRFAASVLVHPRVRGRGLGGRLYSRVLGFVRERAATLLTSTVRADDEAALRFAQARDFTIERHECEPRLDLATWRPDASSDPVVALEAQGVRFFTYADESREAELYELVQRNACDIPGYDPDAGPLPRDTWRKRWLEDPDSPPDGIILAAIDDRLVGVTFMGRYNEAGELKTWHTSVARGSRGRGIAVALKHLAIRAAIRRGAPALWTSNDSRNAAMLRVNAKLGFEDTPGVYYLRCEL